MKNVFSTQTLPEWTLAHKQLDRCGHARYCSDPSTAVSSSNSDTADENTATSDGSSSPGFVAPVLYPTPIAIQQHRTHPTHSYPRNKQ
ncbi:hypothetical protein BC830DRAFT_1129141 [Chytriomyces sp. MP71]|nr:hypothetical protein BC830DRAFT_1129141 [Chytriomyces sp. MP71]